MILSNENKLLTYNTSGSSGIPDNWAIVQFTDSAGEPWSANIHDYMCDKGGGAYVANLYPADPDNNIWMMPCTGNNQAESAIIFNGQENPSADANYLFPYGMCIKVLETGKITNPCSFIHVGGDLSFSSYSDIPVLSISGLDFSDENSNVSAELQVEGSQYNAATGTLLKEISFKNTMNRKLRLNPYLPSLTAINNWGGRLYTNNNTNQITSLPPLSGSFRPSYYYQYSNNTVLREIPSASETFYPGDVRYMFDGCVNVSAGILDMYNHFTSAPEYLKPTTYEACFRNCGISSEAGSAELAQIPDDWK